MSYPCQCPPKVGEPFPYKTYSCYPETLYINYIMSQLLLMTNYFNYVQTGVNQAPYLKNKYSYLVPIYTFKYYSIKNQNILLKTYTYQQLFDISLVASQYKSYNRVPFDIRDNWDLTDKELYGTIVLLPFVESLYQAIVNANTFRAQGLKYSYTFTIPPNIAYINEKEIPPNQVLSKCYPGDELITISRNAQQFVNAYVFNGLFIDYKPLG